MNHNSDLQESAYFIISKSTKFPLSMCRLRVLLRLMYTVLILCSPLHQITIPAQQGNPNSVPRALTVQVIKNYFRIGSSYIRRSVLLFTAHFYSNVKAVLRFRIRRTRMFLGLPDPHPDPLVVRIWLRILQSLSKNNKKNLVL
jgi:hypothetical protein